MPEKTKARPTMTAVLIIAPPNNSELVGTVPASAPSRRRAEAKEPARARAGIARPKRPSIVAIAVMLL